MLVHAQLKGAHVCDPAERLLTPALLHLLLLHCAGQLSEAVAELNLAHTQASEARAAAARLEADLEGLSSAYSSLEAHAFALERGMGEHEAEAGSAGGLRRWGLLTG